MGAVTGSGRERLTKGREERRGREERVARPHPVVAPREDEAIDVEGDNDVHLRSLQQLARKRRGVALRLFVGAAVLMHLSCVRVCVRVVCVCVVYVCVSACVSAEQCKRRERGEKKKKGERERRRQQEEKRKRDEQREKKGAKFFRRLWFRLNLTSAVARLLWLRLFCLFG
jgi:hypothetical protein